MSKLKELRIVDKGKRRACKNFDIFAKIDFSWEIWNNF